MRTNLLLALALVLLPFAAVPAQPSLQEGQAQPERAAQADEVEELLARARALYDEGSFALAREVYLELDALALEPDLARRVELAVADTLWRGAAATDDPDPTRLEEGRRGVLEVVESYGDERDRDETWALAEESLGDFHWDRRGARSWGESWPRYEAALGFWARSTDLERARERWLGIVRKAVAPSEWETWYGYPRWGNRLPRKVARDAHSLARTDEEKAFAYWLLANALLHEGGDPREAARAEEHLEAVLALGRSTGWYDDALYRLGRFHQDRGELVRDPKGGLRFEPRYDRAVEVYRRLVREYTAGATRWRDDALRRIEAIVSPSVQLSVDGTFLPGSKVPLRLSWRNVPRIELSLHRFDPLRDLDPRGDPSKWLERVRVAGLEVAQRWTHETGDAGEHRPGSDELLVPEDPPLGAYVLVARADGVERRELVLVTDAALVVKAADERILAWATDARTGEPIEGAGVLVWQGHHDGGEWRTAALRATAGEDGVATVGVGRRRGPLTALVAAAKGDRVAFARVISWRGRTEPDRFRVLAFTDRPAYRPGDAVGWKVVARTRDGEGAYATPAGAALAYELRDPRSETVAEGELELSDFGTAWAELETSGAMVLGEYRVSFRIDGRHVGTAPLFRLEEYELPEFEVAVSVARDEDGSPRAFRLGERVEAEVRAETYYGAPVGGAEVEVLVRERPFWRPRVPLHPPELPWLARTASSVRPHSGPGQLVHREVLRTGTDGTVSVSFDTPGEGNDLEYSIEARVTDASRREVTGTGAVRVTRQAYYVDLEPAHRIHRPGDEVEVAVAAEDPNGEPVRAEGVLEAVRERMVETWRDEEGREVLGEALERARRERDVFPPPDWEPRPPAIEREVVARTVLTTGEDGRGSWTFRAEREGRYVVTWRSEDDSGTEVEASAEVFVADERTRDLAWHHGGVKIVLDEETLRAGATAPVLLSLPASGGWVLFTVEGEGLLSHEVMRVEGRAKLVILGVTDAFVPNVVLGAVTVRDAEVHVDRKAVRVPPLDHFLEIDVAFGNETYEPGEEGELVVTARDREGNPVRAELALSVYDAAVEAIQGAYPSDPRERFFGDERPHLVAMGTTAEMGRFRKIVLGDEGQPVDEREARRRSEKGTYRGPGDSMAPGADQWFLGRDERLRELGYAGGVERAAMAVRAPAAADAAEGGAVEVVVRTDFRDTALWEPAVVTDGDGVARVPVPFPESTTRWSATARAATAGDRFGLGESSARTKKPLIVRLQAPRFFVAGDEVVVSAVIDNRTEEDLPVRAELELAGLALAGRLTDGELDGSGGGTIAVPAGGTARADWLVRALEPGEARLRVTAVSPEHGDGMERTYPVVPHGIEAFLGRSGRLDGERAAVGVDLPAARRDGTTSLVVQVAPSLAVTMLDALPYLVDYPYGCTEQTLSRFVPAVVALRTLERVGLSREEAARRVFGGIEREHAEATHPGREAGLEDLDDVVAKGLARLYDSQREDGGWGWWPEGDADAWMTAYVVWGLDLAREAGVDVREGVLRRGAQWLERELVEAEERPVLQAWMLHALAGRLAASGAPAPLVENAFANLWERRRHLNAYGTALLALAADALDRGDEARILARNLANGAIHAVQGESSVQPGGGSESGLRTVHWGEDGVSWRWSDGGVEATAFALRALLAVEPESDLSLPALQWLVANRRGAQWKSTRDTAIVVLALSDWMEASGELAAPAAFAVRVNGELVAEQSLSGDDLLAAPSRFAVPADLLRAGENEVAVERTAGEGPLWWSLEATFYSEEEPVPPRGSMLHVRREYWKLVPVPTLLDGVVYEREPLEDGGEVRSGERVEVVLTIEAENHLEYLVFEDLKPAGLEAVQVRSGERLLARELRADEVERRFGQGLRAPVRSPGGTPTYVSPKEGTTGRVRWIHQELRDRKVALFLDRLPQGVWEIRYDLRAETPGRFHALPPLGWAMYVPEIRANGSEVRLEVHDR